jgi:hydroxyethylthiazole kinase-like sugar kinase family protein
MNDSASPARPVATAIRYLSIIVGCGCLLLAAICVAIACQVFIQTGVFAQSYAMVGLISAMLGLLALALARVWK